MLLAAGTALLVAPAIARRRARAERSAAARAVEDDLRTELTRRVDSIERRHDADAADPARAVLELAHVARDWAARAGAPGGPGGSLHAATGAELEAAGLDELAELVRATYPTAFEGAGDDVGAVLAAVRRLLA